MINIPLPEGRAALWILVFLPSLAILYAVSTCIYRLTFHPLAKFPGPKLAACTSLYYLYYISGGRFPQHCEKLFAKYNTNVIRISPQQILFNDPRSLKEVLARPEVFRGDFGLKILGFGQTSVSSIRDHAAHARKRKLLAPGFSNSAVLVQEGKILTPMIDKLVSKMEETRGGVIDMAAYMDFITIDFIAALAFGADFGMLDKLTDHPYFRLTAKVTCTSVKVQAVPEVYKFMEFLYKRGLYVPESIAGIVSYVKPFLMARMQVTDLKDREDIMSIILKRNEEVALESEKMNARELLGEATTIIAGGSDTVAAGLTMIFYHLSQHPAVYARLVSEIRTLFSSYDAITSVVASRSRYLDAIIQESYRLTPSLPGPMWRRNPLPILVAGHMVPPDTEIGIARYSLLRNAACFHDPNTFKPDRWMEDMGDLLEASQMFGVGARSCIGKNIAMVELRVILCKLLWKFDFVPVTRHYDPVEYMVIQRDPLYMRAVPRKWEGQV